MTELNIPSSLLKRLSQFDRLYVGFSGGVDSSVLLHFLSRQRELKPQLTAVHIHHGLSQNADAWLAHCQNICQLLSIPFLSSQIQIKEKNNIEEKARELRFAEFGKLLQSNDALLLAQHQDDQAETVLLRLFRGTGVDGAAAMAKERRLPHGQLIRPLLNCSRQQLLDYARHWDLSWVEDESNTSTQYDRNYLRQKIIPLITARWPAAVANISRFSDHCREAQEVLDELTDVDQGTLNLTDPYMDIGILDKLSHQRQKLLLRSWLKNHHHVLPSSQQMRRIFDELIASRADADPIIDWGAFQLRRYQNKIYLWQPQDCQPTSWKNFPERLSLTTGYLAAEKSPQGFHLPENQQVSVRFRQGGECFYYRSQHKSLKKLFQEWGIPPWLRDCWPLIYVGEQLVVIPGYAVSDIFYSNLGDNWQIKFGQEITR